MSTNIVESIFAHARLRPASAAIIAGRHIITYAHLPHLVGKIAHRLRERGVGPGDTIGVSMRHNPLHLMALLALAQVGAVSLPLHPAEPVERRLLAARRFGADRMLSGNRQFALPGLDFIGLERFPFAGGGVSDDFIAPLDDDAAMRIVISSGTSGDPKGMVLTHGNMALRNQTTEAGVSSSSRVMPMDLNFIVGFRPAMSALAQGATLVFPPQLSIGHILHGMLAHRVTHVYLSPLQARAVAVRAGALGFACPDLVSLRIGGGPVSAAVLQAVQSKVTRNVYVSYGSTESGMVTYASSELLARHPGTVGRVCPWADIEVIDTEDRVLPPGTTGQIRIRSEHQVSGYYRDDERTRRHFRGEWFYPGDLGHFDAEGLLYIDGREDEQINMGGMKIDPNDVEETLCTHPSVRDAGAFVAGTDGNEFLAAALVLSDPSHLDEVRAHAIAKLGPVAPMRYVTVQALPRTLTGKLKRGELAGLYAKSSTAGQGQ